ncbi:MAG: 50S ribosomal protein L37ae [Candidatus Woesearchaeota archaeon]
MATRKQGTAGRFGARGGNILRRKVSDIEKMSRGKHKCMFCGKDHKVRRKAYGIWECGSCNKVFVGKAYRPY